MDRGRSLIVGCYTPGDYCQEAHEKLIPSVRALGLPYEIWERPSRCSWLLNNSLCQLTLLEQDAAFPNDDFLYIDVDGVVRSDPWPYLWGLDCDIAAHTFYGTGKAELLSGTLYLPAGPKRRPLLAAWVALNTRDPHVTDQRNLQWVLDHTTEFRRVELPAEYCCIWDSQRRLTPNIIPVVEHFQASRRYRRRADGHC